jgi:hypothetical protein
MDKIDFRKELPQLYAPKSRDFEVVQVPKMRFLKVDGQGDPNTSPAYVEAMQWLFTVAYTLKFASKARGKDYVVPPPESLWFADDVTAFRRGEKSAWHWTQMLMAPSWITKKDFAAALKIRQREAWQAARIAALRGL